jgi:ATP-binding cassette subfamily B protein
VQNARGFAGFATLQVVNVLAAGTMTTWQMLRISPLLTGLCVLPIAVGIAIVQRGVGTMFTLQRQAQAQLGGLSDDLLGAIQGVATVQAFDVEHVFVERLRGRAADLRETNVAMARLRALVFPSLTVAAGVCVYLLIAVGGPRALAGDLSAGQLAAFVALVAYMVTPLRLLGLLYPVLQRSEASLERIFEVLDATPERPEAGRAVPLPNPGKGPAIELRGLTFAYGDRPILRDVSVSIPAGATVGVFGRTGSGKTTLLRVLARLRNPPEGTVFVDGVDLTRVDLDEWRAQVAMVPQAPFLFSETVRENVGFGAPVEAVREACASAALDPDLAALPEGLETVVGERGIVLSGGQRQRVALARGILRDAPVVLLDDVLSAVDHATEQELVRMLRARAGATRVIVSHRLSALEHADLVLVLDEGRLVDRGTHAELLARPGPYRDAYEAQLA